MYARFLYITFVLFPIFISTSWGENQIPSEIQMQIYPERVSLGDTVYLVVRIKNNSEELAKVRQPDFDYGDDGNDAVEIELSHEETIYRNGFECAEYGHGLRPLIWCDVSPHDSIVLMARPIQIPPLEDLHHPFFEEIIKSLKNNSQDITLDLGIEMIGQLRKMNFFDFDADRVKLKGKITVGLRNTEEMNRIEKWYRATPQDLFPVVRKNKYFRKTPRGMFHGNGGTWILGQNPWKFITTGNRYPGPPNAPETWQGWKKLEESLTPSTMRDEIRLTRILIQYSDTKDTKVLEELKEWFAGMNEVQRICMAKSIFDRKRYCYDSDLLVPFNDLYKTIREYNIAAKSGYEIERLKQLELLE